MTTETSKEAVNATKPSSSKSKTGKALKPKAKIAKEPADNNRTKSNKLNGTPQLKGKKKNNKKNKNIGSVGISEKQPEKKLDIVKKQPEKKLDIVKAKEKGDASKEQNVNDQQTVKPKEKRGSLQKEKINQKKSEDNKFMNSEKNNKQTDKEKHAFTEKNVHREKKKEKVGGLIFMCSAKTKPDCFRYRVMGVTMGKKDLVLGIKPGTKLFLYDFDLRLLYGVYEASSSGGLKLEPTAFNGAFPVQVRFTVHKDCYPLPENVFRKAIIENYNERHKFDTDLTVKQVTKLLELFKPADFVPNAPAINHQPVVIVQSREPHTGDHIINEQVGRHAILPLEDDLRGVSTRERAEFREDTFLSEKDYRIYGLRGERPDPLPPFHAATVLEPYTISRRAGLSLNEREYQTYGLHRERPDPPVHAATALEPYTISRGDGLSLNEREYQTYCVGPRIELQQSHPPVVTSATGLNHDPYSIQYGSLAVDPYRAPTRREDLTAGSYYPGVSALREAYPIKTDTFTRGESHLTNYTYPVGRRASYLTEYDSLRRRENDAAGRIHAAAASRPLFDYNQTRNYQDQPRSEILQAPVSSRYSFAGPSTLYR